MEGERVVKLRIPLKGAPNSDPKYGYFRPVNETALMFAEIARRPTLTVKMLSMINKLGFKIFYSGRRAEDLDSIGAIYEGESSIK